MAVRVKIVKSSKIKTATRNRNKPYHKSHVEDPSYWEYLPLGHVVHSFDPVVIENLPSSHNVHDSAAAYLEYLPTGHAAHSPPRESELMREGGKGGQDLLGFFLKEWAI